MTPAEFIAMLDTATPEELQKIMDRIESTRCPSASEIAAEIWDPIATHHCPECGTDNPHIMKFCCLSSCPIHPR